MQFIESKSPTIERVEEWLKKNSLAFHVFIGNNLDFLSEAATYRKIKLTE